MIRKRATLLFTILMMLTALLKAQTNITLAAHTPYYTGTYTASGSITLAPGFYASGDTAFYARIVPAAASCATLSTSLTGSKNYVATYSVRKAGIPDPQSDTLSGCKINPVIQYFDDLGRPLQTVAVKGAPDLNDLVQPMGYDAYGREFKKYPAYADATNNGSYKSGALSDVTSFYTSPPAGVSRIDSAYAEIKYERSPLNRPLEQGAFGIPWKLGGHTVKIAYGRNITGTVKKWLISGGTVAWDTTHYPANALNKTMMADENGGHSIEYKDMQGRTVLKQTEASSGTYLDTYYVYDDLGNLAYVIPPAVTATSMTESTGDFKDYVYAYRYDSRNRLIRKKIPGKGWDNLVYNKLDQVILSQDSVQRGAGDWTMTKYDAHGRIIKTGIYNDGSDRTTVQAAADGTTPQWEAPSTTVAGGYSAGTYPTSWAGTMTINYYDGYSFPGGGTYTYGPASGQTKGLLTGSKVLVLGTSDTLLTTIFYDDEGRINRTTAQHYKGGHGSINTNNKDETTNTYNFDGSLNSSTRAHYVGGSNTLTIYNRYEYDQNGRKRNTWEKINSADSVLISQLDYNSIGQVEDKKLHSADLAASFLQTQDYTYNQRGWLKTSSAPLFAMELKYNDGTTAQYNGNIADQDWGTPGSLSKSYVYKYDLANRLNSGIAGDNNTEKSIAYDGMGNLTGLRRYINSGAALVDQLKYNYSGNRLTSVEDTTTANTSASYQLPGTTAYSYDVNGNMTARTNSGYNTNDISSITYNYLNLPNVVTGHSATITYTYDANGRKLSKAVSGGHTREYINGIEYDNGSIDFVQTEEGRATPGSPYLYEYSLTDHLGNNRITFDNNSGTARTIQTDDYYPFGLEINSYVSGNKNEYLYNKKELQEETKLYDYGARFYDPVIGRWNVVDPLAELTPDLTPFRYGYNNPIRYIDPYGLWEEVEGGYKTDKKEDIERLFSMISAERSVLNNNPNITEMTNFVKGEMSDGGAGLGSLSNGSKLAPTLNVTGYRHGEGINLVADKNSYENWWHGIQGSLTPDALDPRTLNQNFLGLSYAGSNNPKKYNGEEDYSSKPVHREDIPAYSHDLTYGSLNIKGANGLLNDPRAIPADLKFAGHEFYIGATSLNPIVRFRAIVVGIGVGVPGMYKLIKQTPRVMNNTDIREFPGL